MRKTMPQTDMQLTVGKNHGVSCLSADTMYLVYNYAQYVPIVNIYACCFFPSLKPLQDKHGTKQDKAM